MEENTDFFTQLEEALENYRQNLEGKELPKLKENFRSFHTSFQALFNILVRKGLIQEDPYKNEYRISEVQSPPSGPMKESEKEEEIGRRLSHLDAIFEFLNNYYQFQLDYITLTQIKKLVELTTYIKWNSLTETNNNLNTRVLAENVKKIPQASDKISYNIVSDSIQQLDKLSKEILKTLKKISTYQRENYKYEVRDKILNQMSLKENAITDKKDEVLKAIKRKFPDAVGNYPFYPELVEEVLDETEGENAEQKRKEVLDKLSYKEETNKKKKKEEEKVSNKSYLLDSFRLLSSAGTPLEQAITKLKYNQNLMTQRKLSIGDKFRRWLFNMSNKNEEKQLLEIEYLDPKTATYKPMQLDFNVFLNELQKKTKLLGSLNSKMSNTYQKLESTSEEKVYDYLSQQIEELQAILLKLPALDTYYKHEAPKNQKNYVKGIKLENTAIKNAVVKANQKRHEYIAQKEEEEQLKKLGVVDSSSG